MYSYTHVTLARPKGLYRSLGSMYLTKMCAIFSCSSSVSPSTLEILRSLPLLAAVQGEVLDRDMVLRGVVAFKELLLLLVDPAHKTLENI